MINYLFIKELEAGAGAGEPEPELVDKRLIAPELEPELVLFYSGSPALVVAKYWFCCRINVSDLIKEVTKSCV